MALYFASFLFTKENKRGALAASLRSVLPYWVFAAMIVVPQIIMCAKSGMAERYLLPTTLGLAFLAVAIFRYTKPKVFKFFMVSAIFVFIGISFSAAKTDAVAFAEIGKDENSVLALAKDNSGAESKILFVADPVDRFEVTHSIRSYLSFYGRNNFYGYPIMRAYTSEHETGLRDQWIGWFENRKLEDLKAAPDMIIVFDKIHSETFFSKSEVRKAEYRNVFADTASHALYVRKGN